MKGYEREFEVINLMCEKLTGELGAPVRVERNGSKYHIIAGETEIGVETTLRACYNILTIMLWTIRQSKQEV